MKSQKKYKLILKIFLIRNLSQQNHINLTRQIGLREIGQDYLQHLLMLEKE